MNGACDILVKGTCEYTNVCKKINTDLFPYSIHLAYPYLSHNFSPVTFMHTG